jgi:hypothetical protein
MRYRKDVMNTTAQALVTTGGCPFCLSAGRLSHVGGERDYQKGIVIYTNVVTCGSCGRQWHESYVIGIGENSGSKRRTVVSFD